MLQATLLRDEMRWLRSDLCSGRPELWLRSQEVLP
jgi:hypothetical protein